MYLNWRKLNCANLNQQLVKLYVYFSALILHNYIYIQSDFKVFSY
jgi:hypothetical protein